MNGWWLPRYSRYNVSGWIKKEYDTGELTKRVMEYLEK